MARARTAKQRAALRKAQLASARKRKGRGKKRLTGKQLGRRVALVAAVGGAVGFAGAVQYERYSAKKRFLKDAAYVRQASWARINRNKKIRRGMQDWAMDRYLKKMQYGRGGFVRSQRMSPLSGLKALPRGRG